MNLRSQIIICPLIVLSCYADTAIAAVRLPQLFADHMVLQREVAVPVWGWADPGESVIVDFAGQSKNVTTSQDGKWRVKLDAMHASADGRKMTVHGSNSEVAFSDVLVGEVWLAGGQSNMDSPVSSLHDAAEVLPKAQDMQLRFFKVSKKTAAEPQTDCKGTWEESTSETAKNFSAVAYYFAQQIRSTQNCPVAVIQSSWGGTDIETWISLQGLKQNPPVEKTLHLWDQAVVDYEKTKADPNLVPEYEKNLKQWQTDVSPAYNTALKQWNADHIAHKEVGPKPQPSQPEPINPDPMAIPNPSSRPKTPTVNFNGMIAPLAPFAIRGVIWYQGENNGSRGLEYRQLFPHLIEDWRKQWNMELPFVFVQLPCNGKDTAPVATNGWPWLREAQLMTLKLPRTGMAITIDIGDPNNVHPADKIDVGQRLALAARKLAYGEKLVASGPLFKTMETHGDKLTVHFNEIGGGLIIGQQPWCANGVAPFPTDKLIGFFLAGDDKKWAEAEANIVGDSVVLSSPEVSKPIAVRYGWANSPRCNLYNKEGLPVSPFRTDDWAK